MRLLSAFRSRLTSARVGYSPAAMTSRLRTTLSLCAKICLELVCCLGADYLVISSSTLPLFKAYESILPGRYRMIKISLYSKSVMAPNCLPPLAFVKADLPTVRDKSHPQNLSSDMPALWISEAVSED